MATTRSIQGRTIESYAVYTGSDYRVVVTDGTAAGTHVLNGAGPIDDPGGDVSHTQVAGDDNLVFINTYYYLAGSGGISKHLFAYLPQTGALTHLRDAQFSGEDDPPFADGGRLFFQSTDTMHADEPWLSDGTVAGTQIIANVAQEIRTNSSNPAALTDVNGTLYFAADDGIHGTELWKSDGTASGTSLAFDISPGAAGSNPTQLVAWNGSLYFFAGNPTANGFMRTTGTLSTVTTLAALTPEPPPQDPITNPGYDPNVFHCASAHPVPFNGRLYFGASDGTSGFELWSTDGTPGGTTLVADIDPGSQSSTPCGLTVFNGRLYFEANPSGRISDFELWSTDGTTAGTGPALPGVFTQIDAFGVDALGGFVVFNNRMYFVALDTNGTVGLYSTDGTAAGTQLVKASSTTPATPLVPIGVSNGLLVLQRLVTSGTAAYQELWVSDGTAAGTVQVAGVQMPPSVGALILTSNLIYFTNSESAGVYPWVSDGTAAGTHRLADLTGGVSWLADVHGEVYFSSNDSRIWRTDGTTAGTLLVTSTTLQGLSAFQVSGQNLFFAATDNTAGRELYVLQNDAPVAANDSASSNGSAVTISVLANDTDPDGVLDPASVHITSQPAHGSVSVTSSGSVVYTPSAGYQGSDSFTYTVADNQGAPSNAATVTVTTTLLPPSSSGGSGTGGGGGSGGGGAVGLLDLLALASLVGLRRRARQGELTVSRRHF